MNKLGQFFGALCLIGGIFFLYIAVTSLDNSITIAAGAAAACAFFVLTLMIIVGQGLSELHKKQDEQTRLLEMQVTYLKYLAQRERDRLQK